MRNIKSIIILIAFCTLKFTGFSQTKFSKEDSLITYSFDCEDSLSIKIPNGPFEISRFYYEEGFILTVQYQDSSRISILCGSNAQLAGGNNDKNLYFRSENIKGRQIIYDRVPQDRLSIFNAAFNLLEKPK